MSKGKSRISAAPVRVQMVRVAPLQQVQRIGATTRVRGRARQEARLRIWLRDGPHCAHCGGLVDITPGTRSPFELDHIIPLWKGGKDSDGNRQCLCPGCHSAKTATEAAERART